MVGHSSILRATTGAQHFITDPVSARQRTEAIPSRHRRGRFCLIKIEGSSITSYLVCTTEKSALSNAFRASFGVFAISIRSKDDNNDESQYSAHHTYGHLAPEFKMHLFLLAYDDHLPRC